MKTAAIIGYGVEGKANAEYFFDLGYQVTIIDHNLNQQIPSNYGARLGQQAFESDLSEYDIVVRSPGIRPDRLLSAREITSMTKEFFAKCPAVIIGVTGTKGKGTTCSLIASILRAAGQTVHLVGNIGVPSLQILPQIKPTDVVIYELSSFQLWDQQKSPHIAVITMVEPDHMDVHSDFNEYINAKTNIVRYQTRQDKVFYYNNQYSAQIAKNSLGQKIAYGIKSHHSVYITDDIFCFGNKTICSTDKLQLAGQHNLLNACGSINVCLEFTQDPVAIARGLADFKGLDHRLKLVAIKNSVKYYDDSIATTDGSAVAALKSFIQPKIIILGGSDKGSDYESVLKVAKATNSTIIAIGQTGQMIHQKALSKGINSHRVEGLMDQVITKASQIAKPNSIVILSPASASFDQYQNYQDRGNQFIKAIKKL